MCRCMSMGWVVALWVVVLLGSGYGKQHDRSVEKSSIGHTIEMEWGSRLSKGLKEAQAKRRPLLVMISEPGCRWCVKLKKQSFSDTRVQRLLEGFVRVKIRRSDRAQSGQIQAFDGKIPSLFVLTPKGEVVTSIVGYYKPEDFLSYLQEVTREVREAME